MMKRFSVRCSTCGLVIETDDAKECEAAERAHLRMHKHLYRKEQLALALGAPDVVGALKFFGLLKGENDG